MVCCSMQAFLIYLLPYFDGWMCILEARGNEDGLYGARDRLYLPLYAATTVRVSYSAVV